MKCTEKLPLSAMLFCYFSDTHLFKTQQLSLVFLDFRSSPSPSRQGSWHAQAAGQSLLYI